MSVDIFKDTRTNLPDNDSRIVRVNFNEDELGARRGFLPSPKMDGRFSIAHVTNPRSK